MKGLTNKLIVSPFYICTLCALGTEVAKAFGKEKISENFKKSYIIIFLIYYFFSITYFTINLLHKAQYSGLIVATIFFVVGFFMIYMFFL